MKILVTGAAGFIGFHLSQRLLARGDEVVGLDCFNDYYDVSLKEARAQRLAAHPGFRMERRDIVEREGLAALLAEQRFDGVVHLAAQAGVRYSIEHPEKYIEANLVGFGNMLESCRQSGVGHLVYASSSSVYGNNHKVPFSVHDPADHPMSLYAATKRANELMAHSYAHLFRIPMTGLRFFTVYGPWGRPDMAPQKFTARIFAGDPIEVYNGGKLMRDFTFVGDIVEGVVRVLDHIPVPDEGWNAEAPTPDGSGVAPYRVFNIGRGAPVDLMDFIATLERKIGRKANMHMVGMQPGDVEGTWCDVSALDRAVGYRPSVSLDEGLEQTVAWFRAYYHV